MRYGDLKDILRITTYVIDMVDENVDVEVVTVGNWLALMYTEKTRNDGVYLLRQMLEEKDMFVRGNRIDLLIEKIVESSKAIHALLFPDLSKGLVDLLVKLSKIKYNNHLPEEMIDDLRQLATLIAGGYSMNDFLSGREQCRQNALSEEVYETLEITSSATDEEVIKAFRKLSLKYHPDRLGNASVEEKEWASRKLQAIVEAKNLIMAHRQKN